MNLLRLGDSLEVLIDHRGKTPKKLGSDFTVTGVPVASAILVANGSLDLSNARCVPEQTWRRWMSVPTRRGDVLLTSEAPLGRVARVPSDAPLVLGQRLYGLRGKAGVLDSGYLYYALQTERVQTDLVGRSTGTTVFGIRQSALRQVMIPAPDFSEQQAIAEVLGGLDDKIAANANLVATVDDLLASRFAALVPGSASAALSSIADVNVASAKPTAGGSLRYLDIASVGVGSYDFPEIMGWEEAPGRARRIIRHGDTVWSTVRPNRRSHALVLDDDPLLIASTGLAVLTPKLGQFAFVYEATRTPQFTAYLESAAEGSAYPAVRADRFLDAPVPDVGVRARENFESLAAPLRRRVLSAAVESRTLGSMRDALLPQLMSGRIRVSDAERVLEGVV